MKKQPISSNRLPPPVGPFSPAIQYGDLFFLSGQVGINPATGKLADGDIETQTEQVLSNLKSLLDACNKTLDDAVRVGVYMTDMTQFARMNAVYARHFSTPYPARTTIGVAALPLGALVEIDMWVAAR
jgi:2-iminobutanoate/2-iminopropanoate deaminase